MADAKKYPLRNVEVRLKLSDAQPIYSDHPMDSPERAVAAVRDILSDMDREYVCVVNLDTHMRPIGFNVVSIGGLSQCEVPIQNVFKSAILQNSAALLAFHNHPSGVAEPSIFDDLITEKLVAAGDLLGIPVKDHLIIAAGNGGIYSYYEHRPELFRTEPGCVAEKHFVRDIKRTGRGTSSEGSRTGREKIEEITERLDQGVKELFTSEKYVVWLKTMSAFHHYSFNNTLLIALQAPEATYVASYQTWKKLHRQVRKGEKGIKILVPAPVKVKHEERKLDPVTKKSLLDPDGRPLTETKELVIQHFKIGHVFAYEQTEGEPLPELGPDELTGSVPNYESLKEVLMEISPVPVRFDAIEGGAKGYFSHSSQEIVIKNGMSELQTVKTMIHEISHSTCHDRERSGEEGYRKDRQTKEVESDSISFTVCAMLGLDVSDYVFPYIAGWSSSKELKELRGSMEMIRETSGQLLNQITEKLREKEISEKGISLKDSMAEGRRQSVKMLLSEPVRENSGDKASEKQKEIC